MVAYVSRVSIPLDSCCPGNPSVVTFSLLACTGILTVPDNLETCNPGMVMALFNLTGALMFMIGDSVLSTASRHRTMLPIDPLLQAVGKFLISSNVALSRIILMCSVPKRMGILAPYSVSLTTSMRTSSLKPLISGISSQHSVYPK